MKKEFLFRALGDVGDDLIHKAEHMQFTNQWKKWLSLAACLVLVVSLGILALPYFPMGCGASSNSQMTEAPAAAETAAPEAQAEEAPAEEKAAAEEKTQAEAETTEEAVEDTEPEVPTEEAVGSEAGGTAAETTRIVVRSTYYYLDPGVVLKGEKPGNVGQYIGDVTASDDESLIGCPVYEVMYSTWFSNFAVDGQSVPQMIYVEGPEDWIYGVTGNEKTVARYTAEDVQNAIDTENTQWIIDTFVRSVEAQSVEIVSSETADSESLNKLFLASLSLNTGTEIGLAWAQEDGSLLVHPADVERRLARFLDDFTYVPDETEAYDPESGMLRFSVEDRERTAEGLYLKHASVEGNMVWLWVGLPESDDLYDEIHYQIRFDTDSWRYLCIVTPG